VVTELRVLSRSIGFLVVAIGFPAVFFLVMSEVFGSQQSGSLDMTTYMMISMAAFGAVSGAISTGARVAQERQEGWNRTLRLTPLPGWSYVGTKVIVAMIMVVPTLLLILLTGFLIKGVELSVAQWGQVLLAAWLGSLPFSLIGVVIGLAAKPGGVPAFSTTTFLMLSMFGGLWFPMEIMPGFMQAFAKALPSFWLADQARSLVSGGSPAVLGLVVVTAWFLVCAALVVTLYRRDASRA